MMVRMDGVIETCLLQAEPSMDVVGLSGTNAISATPSISPLYHPPNKYMAVTSTVRRYAKPGIPTIAPCGDRRNTATFVRFRRSTNPSTHPQTTPSPSPTAHTHPITNSSSTTFTHSPQYTIPNISQTSSQPSTQNFRIFSIFQSRHPRRTYTATLQPRTAPSDRIRYWAT